MKAIMKMFGIVILLAALMPMRAKADEHLTGYVTRIYPNGDGVNFWLSTGCKTSSQYSYWRFSIGTDLGKAWYAMLLSAAATKSPVKIAYPGTCDPAQHQTVSYVYQDF